MKKTICILCDELEEQLNINNILTKETVAIIKQIRNRANAMEARLLKYREAIEDLGYTRDTK